MGCFTKERPFYYFRSKTCFRYSLVISSICSLIKTGIYKRIDRSERNRSREFQLKVFPAKEIYFLPVFLLCFDFLLFNRRPCNIWLDCRVEYFSTPNYALISGHPGGLTTGNPQAFAPRHLQIPPTQGQYSSTKSYHCPSPGSII